MPETDLATLIRLMRPRLTPGTFVFVSTHAIPAGVVPFMTFRESEGTTLILPGRSEPLTTGWEIREELEPVVDLIIDGGACGLEPTTVVDLTGAAPALVRAGRGALEPFGFPGNPGAGTGY